MEQDNPYRDMTNPAGDILAPHDQILVVVPKWNSRGKHDSTGAFRPGAIAFCREHNIPASVIRYFDNRKSRAAMAEEVLGWISDIRPKVFIAFCHGYTHGVQFGIRSPNHRAFSGDDEERWFRFVGLLSSRVVGGFTAPVVVLWACSTGDDPDGDDDTAPGSGDGSFADELRDDLCDTWATCCRVFAHTTSGHAWYNPYVKFFDGGGSHFGARGSTLLALPGSGSFRSLKRRLKTPWAFRLPFQPVAVVRELLKKG